MPPQIPDEFREILERLQRDLQYLQRDEIPPGVDLSAAPLLEHWAYTDPPNALIGVVSGHPRLNDGWITTSRLIWISKDFQVARTLSRFYRLGRPLGADADTGQAAPDGGTDP